MRILITGSAGFIGSHLVPYLKSREHEIICFDISEGWDIFDRNIEGFVGVCDIVIHLAALTSVNQSFEEPGKVFQVNVLGTARVAELCLRYKKKLIYPSSAAIYHRELSPYAETKALAEDIVKGIMRETPTVILRLFNVFGSNMNPNSGSVMYNFLNDSKLLVFGDGEQTRDFIHVRDVISIIDASLADIWNGEVVDCGTGEAYTMNYVAGLFSYFRGLPIEYQPPRREIKWSVANNTALRRLYDRPMTTSLRKDIEELCQK